MQKKYIVRLSEQERATCREVIRKLKGTSEKVRRAQILLKADAAGPAWTDAQIAEAFSCRTKTVENIRQRVVELGFERALERKNPQTPPANKLLDGELERQIDEAGITDRVRLMGFRRDVPDMMRAVDVMCLPSHREPFGLVYVEAALAEKPVIACEAGGAPEIIEHEETGLLVRPQNVPDLTQAILTLLDNPSHAARMGRRAREQALERFTWPRYLAKLHDVYCQVIGREAAAQATANRRAA